MKASVWRAAGARALRAAAAFAVAALLLFGIAGRADLPWLWAYAAVVALMVAAAVSTLDADRVGARKRYARGGLDPMRLAIIQALFLAHFTVGLLDAGRFHWSEGIPWTLRATALLVFAAALGWTLWAVRVNRFWVPTVTIQAERGHHAVTDGPYRVVRHPGYLGLVLAAPASGLALGSWWALGIGAFLSALFVARAAAEDRFLIERLPGYREYAAGTRHRLVPGLW